MNTLGLDTILQTDPRLTVREIGEDTIIVSERGEELHVLNTLGQAVWRALDGRRTLREVVERICAEYCVSHAVAEADLRRFASELECKGLVHSLAGQS